MGDAAAAPAAPAPPGRGGGGKQARRAADPDEIQLKAGLAALESDRNEEARAALEKVSRLRE
jgi:hypothetical protein